MTLRPVRVNPTMPLPQPVAKLPAPKWLARDGKAAWRTITGIMAGLGYLTTAYAIELEELCWWYERVRGLRRQMKGSDDPDRNLSARVLEASRELRASAAKLGLNPQDIGRIRAQKVDGEDEELKRLLGLDPGRVN